MSLLSEHLSEHAVVIAGGGPTGMMLAGELRLAGVDAAIVERRESVELVGSRAGGLHARTIEVLDQRGIADRFLKEGQRFQSAGFAHVPLDISDCPTRYNHGLALWQKHFERILAGWIEELGVPVYRGREVTGFTQDESGVEVALSDGLSDGQSLRARYLVGCDGGRSVVRKAAGIAFPGWDATVSHLLAEVELTEEPEWGIHRTALGVHSFGKARYEIRDGKIVYLDGGPIGVMVTEEQVGATTEPSFAILSGYRGLWDGLRCPQPGLDHAVHGCRAPGPETLSPQGRVLAGGRRRARALHGGRAGP